MRRIFLPLLLILSVLLAPLSTRAIQGFQFQKDGRHYTLREKNRVVQYDLLAGAQTGKTSLLLEEQSEWFVDIHDNLTFLEDGKRFLWTSEKDGWNHLKGKLIRQLTKGACGLPANRG